MQCVVLLLDERDSGNIQNTLKLFRVSFKLSMKESLLKHLLEEHLGLFVFFFFIKLHMYTLRKPSRGFLSPVFLK